MLHTWKIAQKLEKCATLRQCATLKNCAPLAKMCYTWKNAAQLVKSGNLEKMRHL